MLPLRAFTMAQQPVFYMPTDVVQVLKECSGNVSMWTVHGVLPILQIGGGEEHLGVNEMFLAPMLDNYREMWPTGFSRSLDVMSN